MSVFASPFSIVSCWYINCGLGPEKQLQRPKEQSHSLQVIAQTLLISPAWKRWQSRQLTSFRLGQWIRGGLWCMFLSLISSIFYFLFGWDEVCRSEVANIDKMMHILDYGRALEELLELDNTIRASIKCVFFSPFFCIWAVVDWVVWCL